MIKNIPQERQPLFYLIPLRHKNHLLYKTVQGNWNKFEVNRIYGGELYGHCLMSEIRYLCIENILDLK